MQGETLLRLRRYEEAFATFDRLAKLHLEEPLIPWENREVSVAWVVHEMTQRQSDNAGLEKVLQGLTSVFVNAFGDAVSERTGRTLMQTLPADLHHILRTLPPREMVYPPIESRNVLAHHDWSRIQRDYLSNGLVVVDQLLSPWSLEALRQWANVTPSFQTQRAGFVGAFPSNGANYALIRYVVEALEDALPEVLRDHTLGLWWFFKYAPGVGGNGIGLHADPAAVNMNFWLTRDEACVHGGGLEIYSHIPPSKVRVQEYNHEFSTKEEEEALIATLKDHAWEHVEYKENRAVFFVSERYHRSVPFEFHAETLLDWRLNLTLLFGDRGGQERRLEMSVAPPEQEGWKLFE